MEHPDEFKQTELETTTETITTINSKQAKKVFSKLSIILLLSYLVPIFSVIFIYVFLYLADIYYVAKKMPITLDINLIMFLFIYLCTKNMPCDNTKQKNISIKNLIKYLLVSVLFAIIGSIIGQLVSYALYGNNAVNPVNEAFENNFLTSCISSLIIAPIIEELIFRKILIDRLAKFGQKAAIVFSAVCFAIYHGNFFQFFYALILGLIFGYVYFYSRKIVYTMTLHFFINLFGGVLSHFLAQFGYEYIGGLILISLAIVGIFVLVKNWGKIKLKESDNEISVSTMFLNVGFVLFLTTIIFINIYIPKLSEKTNSINNSLTENYFIEEDATKSIEIAAINKDETNVILKLKSNHIIKKIIFLDQDYNCTIESSEINSDTIDKIFDVPQGTKYFQISYLDIIYSPFNKSLSDPITLKTASTNINIFPQIDKNTNMLLINNISGLTKILYFENQELHEEKLDNFTTEHFLALPITVEKIIVIDGFGKGEMFNISGNHVTQYIPQVLDNEDNIENMSTIELPNLP